VGKGEDQSFLGWSIRGQGVTTRIERVAQSSCVLN